MHWEDKCVMGENDISILFRKYFENVFVPERYQFTPSSVTNNVVLKEVTLDLDIVFSALEDLDPKQGAGPNKLPLLFV